MKQDFSDMLFILAAGNDGIDLDHCLGDQHCQADYPSLFKSNERISHMLVVAAVDREHKLADFSNYGKNTADIAALGVEVETGISDIEVEIPGGGTFLNLAQGKTQKLSGTSFAAPQVSRVAGRILAMSKKATSEGSRCEPFSPIEIIQIIQATVTCVEDLGDKVRFGGVGDGVDYGGALNEAKALEVAQDIIEGNKSLPLKDICLGGWWKTGDDGKSVEITPREVFPRHSSSGPEVARDNQVCPPESPE